MWRRGVRTSHGISLSGSRLPGWPTRMSRPLAAKGVGASISHACSQRPASSRVRLAIWRRIMGCAAWWRGTLGLSGFGVPSIVSAGIGAVSRRAPREDDGAEPHVERELCRRRWSSMSSIATNSMGWSVLYALPHEPGGCPGSCPGGFLRLSAHRSSRFGSILRPTVDLRQIARNLLKDRAKAARRHLSIVMSIWRIMTLSAPTSLAGSRRAIVLGASKLL